MKRLIKIILIIFPLSGFCQTWNQLSAFSGDGRHHPITFGNDQYGFVIAGSYLDDVYKYDKANDLWLQLQDTPFGGRGYSYGVTVGNKAYIGFGSSSPGVYPVDWWEYDMDNDVWNQKASFPGDGRNHPAMLSVGNKIFVGCGSNAYNLKDWWEYNISTDSWIQKPDLPANERHHPFYFGIGDYAYVGFGHGIYPGPGSNSTGSYIYNDFYRYDPINASWMQMANFPSEARVAGTQFSYNGKGYILSGDGDDHGPLSSGEFWEYDPTNDSWNQLQSHPGGAIWAPGNFVIGCDVYFLLGQDWNTNAGIYPTDVYSYKLSEDCGCTDNTAFNFSSLAITDDGSCCYVSGCTDPLALNYDNLSCYDDGSCIDPVLGCTNPSAINFDPNANTTVAFGGALDNTFGSGGYFNGDQHLVFDATKECVIKSATIDAESSSTIVFELRNSNGVVIDDTTLNVVSGQQQVILNFEVPIGNDMQLGVAAGALQNIGLYRNSDNAIYPYDIASSINITNSSAGTGFPGYYYFYYNIEVEVMCDGVNNSSSWDCDNQGNCYDPGNGQGVYSSLSDCEVECINLSIQDIGITNLKIFPNPSDQFFNIEFVSNELQDLKIKVINILGDNLFEDYLIKFQGKYTKRLDLYNIKNGVYLLEIETNKGLIYKKLILNK